MKFFRQTKETKRKLSFFLALAMVISLLPVTPVVKAATTATPIEKPTGVSSGKVKVDNKSNLNLKSLDSVKVTPNSSNNTTGSVIVTLEADEEIDSNSVKKLTVNANPVTDSAVSTTGTSIYATILEGSANKKVTVGVKDIDLSKEINITINGTVGFKQETPTTHTVTIESNLGEGIKLDITGDAGITKAGTFPNIATGKKVTLTISRIDSSKVFIERPALTVNNTKQNWTNDSVTITITDDTSIKVTGGVVGTVADNTVNTKATPAPEVKKETGINEVSISSENSNSDLAKNLAAGALTSAQENIANISVKDKDGKEIKVTDEVKEQIIAALSNPETKMNTSLNLGIATSGAIDKANKLVNSSTTSIDTNDIKDEKQKKALGSNPKAAAQKMLKDGVALDITLTGSFEIKSGNGTTSAAITISKVDEGIKVTMDVPGKYMDNTGKPKTGYYYAIRIHGDEVSILPCKLEGGKISFVSNRFSTYVISYIEGSSDNNNNNNNNSGNNNNGYIPGPGTTSSSAPSANPSVTPSTNPSGAPSANPSGAPSANPSGAPSANPSSAPSANPSSAPSANPTNSPANPTKKPSTSSTVKVGKKATISGSQYKVTAVKGTRTVQFTKGKKNAKKIVIPSTVKVSGKKYKVTSIAKNALKGNKKLTKLTIGANVTKIGVNAFKGCSKLKSIIVKTKKLTKSKVGKNAFKGINSKATIKVPKAKVKAYKKIVQAKGAGKGVKVKK